MIQDNFIIDDEFQYTIKNVEPGSIEVGIFDNTTEEENASLLEIDSDFKYKILNANDGDVNVRIYEGDEESID